MALINCSAAPEIVADFMNSYISLLISAIFNKFILEYFPYLFSLSWALSILHIRVMNHVYLGEVDLVGEWVL